LVEDVAYHPFVAALDLAFNDHRPVCISPDMIWLLIAQGFAQHVTANSETLRHRFVRHEGKVDLEVHRDDFIKGSPENPWPEVIAEFTTKIRDHTGNTTHDLLVPTFSTTRPAEKTAFELVLMDALQPYFGYSFFSKCGIPAITLEGTVEDWERIVRGVACMARYDLEWWTRPLLGVLDQIISSVRGNIDQPFWRSIYKHLSVSGGDRVTGWVVAFFPYFNRRERNPWLNEGDEALAAVLHASRQRRKKVGHSWTIPDGPRLSELPSGVSRAPFLWDYRGQRIDMEFLGGFLGVSQGPTTHCLRPEIGWAIREAVAHSVAGSCSYCQGSGECYCKRRRPGSTDECPRCQGSGKCHVCRGEGASP
jgi:hypothetical protein